MGVGPGRVAEGRARLDDLDAKPLLELPLARLVARWNRSRPTPRERHGGNLVTRRQLGGFYQVQHRTHPAGKCDARRASAAGQSSRWIIPAYRAPVKAPLADAAPPTLLDIFFYMDPRRVRNLLCQ